MMIAKLDNENKHLLTTFHMPNTMNVKALKGSCYLLHNHLRKQEMLFYYSHFSKP